MPWRGLWRNNWNWTNSSDCVESLIENRFSFGNIICFMLYRNIDFTRTAGAAGPLVIESGSSVFFCFFLYFTTPIFVPIQHFFNFTTIFTTNVYHRSYHKFYHKLLPQTTVIIGVSISTTTPIFVPIQQFFNFTTNFTTHFYHIFYYKFYHKPLS